MNKFEKPADRALDGAAFYTAPGLHVQLYDLLYGDGMASSGDLACYESLAALGDGMILDAACGTGRVFSALARPGRQLYAFDVSDTQLARARERARNLQATAPIAISKQRLENFSLSWRFDLIVLAYYCFGNLLDATERAACLRRIAQHLKPEGRAVLHLAAPHLLSREVPPQELETMRTTRGFKDRQGNEFRIEHAITRMTYEPERALRAMHIDLKLLDSAGTALRSDTTTMYYACITAEELQSAAEAAGLAVVDMRSGFKEGVDTELVALLKLR